MSSLPRLPLVLTGVDAPVTVRDDPQVVLRPAGPDDAAALRAFYLAQRAPEFSGIGLPEAVFAVLLDGQFRAQQAAYTGQFPDLATFAFISEGLVIGRLMLASETDPAATRAVRIVDIALADVWRGQGLGGAALARVAAAARASGFAALNLQVALMNPGARRLYERLGFVAGEGALATDGLSIEMRKALA